MRPVGDAAYDDAGRPVVARLWLEPSDPIAAASILTSERPCATGKLFALVIHAKGINQQSSGVKQCVIDIFTARLGDEPLE